MIIFEYKYKGGITLRDSEIGPFLDECFKKSHGHYVYSNITLADELRLRLYQQKISLNSFNLLYLKKTIDTIDIDNQPKHFTDIKMNFLMALLPKETNKNFPPPTGAIINIIYDNQNGKVFSDGEFYQYFKQKILDHATNPHAQAQNFTISQELCLTGIRALVTKGYINAKDLTLTVLNNTDREQNKVYNFNQTGHLIPGYPHEISIDTTLKIIDLKHTNFIHNTLLNQRLNLTLNQTLPENNLPVKKHKI